MKNMDRDKLMHAALDGDAMPEQARELDALLAADPAAREQFAELQRLFVALRQVPQAYPPEGLVARVMEQLPQRSARRRQLSGASRVLGTEAIELRGKTAGNSSTVRPQGGASWGWFGMGTNKGLSKGKLWIGGGIAAVALLAVAKLGFDVPSAGDSVSGTVVPAERYRGQADVVGRREGRQPDRRRHGRQRWPGGGWPGERRSRTSPEQRVSRTT